MKDANITKRLLVCVFAVVYCLILPIFALEIILENYITYSSLNLTLAYLGFLAHIDVAGYFIYRHITKVKDKK